MAEEDSEVKEETIHDFFKKLTSYLPLLTVVCLGIGIIDELIYYYPFHLNILIYTDINEVVFDAITNLLLSVLFYSLINIISKHATYLTIKYWQKNTGDTKAKNEVNIRRTNIKMLISFLVLTLISIIIYENLNPNALDLVVNQLLIKFLYIFLNIFFILLFYLKLILININYDKLKYNYISIFSALYILLSYNIMFTLLSCSMTMKLNTYGTYVKIGSTKIISDRSNYYIGRTRNFIFFYNVKEDITTVYQNKDVSEFVINYKGVLRNDEEELINEKLILKHQLKKIDSLNKLIKIETDSLNKITNEK